MGTDEEARQHVVALAKRLHEFGHRTEAREMELWHRLGHATQLPEMEQKMANYKQEMADEFHQFTQQESITED